MSKNVKGEAAVLARLLATPPDHKPKPKSGASPKKRGRPRKEKNPAQRPSSEV
jgi:hypothetical protein